MDLVDQEFKTTIRTLEVLAASPSLHEGDLQTFHRELVGALKTQPGWKTIVLHSPDGTFLLSALKSFGETLGRQSRS